MINVLEEFYEIEVGYNGANICDTKTTFPCVPEQARWLAQVLFKGLEAEAYSGGYIVIKGPAGAVKLDQFSASDLIDTDYELPQPFKK